MSTPEADETAGLARIFTEISAGITSGPAAAANVFERYTAPEYIFTSPSGDLSSRDEILAGLRDGFVSFSSYSVHDLHVRLYGDVAVVLGRAAGDGINPGGERFQGTYRFTSVWSRAQGEWMLVAWQATAIARQPGSAGAPTPGLLG